jgi:hypothetical protein
MPKPEDKPFVIPKPMVWEAWRRVRANKGAPGVDGQAIEQFEADLAGNLYKIWNRMSSGSYFPPAVRAVEIPKPHGGGFECWACRRSPTGLRRRSWLCTWRNGRTTGSTRTPMATGRASRPIRRSRHAGSGAGRTTG